MVNTAFTGILYSKVFITKDLGQIHGIYVTEVTQKTDVAKFRKDPKVD